MGIFIREGPGLVRLASSHREECCATKVSRFASSALAVVIHAASIQDRDGARLVLAKLLGRFARLQTIWADATYTGRLVEWAWATGGWLLQVVRRNPDSHQF